MASVRTSARAASLAAGLMLVIGSLESGAVSAQGSSVTFKNFHRYPPSGLWSQELSGTQNGVSTGPPIETTSCAGASTPDNMALIKKLSDNNPGRCKSTVITDTERLAEYEMTCNAVGAQHVIHSTMRMVDDKTLTVDTRDTMPGFVETKTHSTVTYKGPCSAPANKPSAAECAELTAEMQDPKVSVAQCAELPPEYQAKCASQIDTGRKAGEALVSLCH